MRDLIAELTDKDDKKAYARVKEIAAASEQSPEYYSRLDGGFLPSSPCLPYTGKRSGYQNDTFGDL